MVVAPVADPIDRSMAVPPGALVCTGYVSVWAIKLACRERMAIGDIQGAYTRRLSLGDHQPWPPPRGHWEGAEFVIVDGRHEYLAAVALGLEYILVAWVEQ